MNVKNPMDVGPSGQFPTAFQAMMNDESIHMILAIIAIPYAAFSHMASFISIDEFFFGSQKPLKEYKWPKPFVICVVSHQKLVQMFKKSYEPNIPVYTTPENATKSLAALWRYRRWKEQSC